MRKKPPHNVTDRFNLLVIDFPYFKKTLDDSYRSPERLGFFVAHRDSAFKETWTVERQFYTRRTDSMGVSDSDFDHRPTLKVEGVTALIQEFQKFELECLQNGMERNDRDGSSYTYGACLPHALRLLGLDETAAPKVKLG